MMKRIVFGMAVMMFYLFIQNLSAFADLYSYKDKNGVVHFSNEPVSKYQYFSSEAVPVSTKSPNKKCQNSDTDQNNLGNNDHKAQETTALQKSKKSTHKKPQAHSDALSFDEIEKNCNGLTDAQFKEYCKTLIGQTVTWKGTIKEVDENFFGSNYEVKLIMKPAMGYHVSFDVSKSVALQLTKGATYKFTGKIEFAASVLGRPLVTLKDVQM